MKVSFVLIGVFFSWQAVAQEVIEVCVSKPTILNFPTTVADVKSGDEESYDVMKKGKVVFVRAMDEGLDDSNVFVELVDGSVYVFDIHFGIPKKSVITVLPSMAVESATAGDVPMKEKENASSNNPVIDPVKALELARIASGKKGSSPPKQAESIVEPIGPVSISDAGDVRFIERVYGADDYLYSIGQVAAKMEVGVGGIWYNDADGLMYFKVNLYNKGRLPYKILAIGMTVDRSGKSLKNQIDQAERKVIEEKYSAGLDVADYEEVLTVVLAVKKFSLPEGKVLNILINEKSGSRNFNVKVEPKDLYSPKTDF